MATILVIDDEPVDRMIVAEVLRAEGHDVVEASNGAEGIKAIDKADLDVLVTDLIMPDKDGIETIMEIRQSNPDLKILAVSGGGRHGDLSSLEVAKDLGADSTLAKPIDAERLIAIVNELLT